MEEQLKTNEASSLNIKELFYKYVRFLPLFILSVVFAVFVAFVYLRYVTPIYSSSGSLIIKDESSSAAGGGGDDKFQQMFVLDNQKNIQNEIEILRSKPLLERVVEKLDINLIYYVKGNVREINEYNKAPITLKIISLSDSAHAFSQKFEFTNGRFRVNEETKLHAFDEVFTNKYGSFILQAKRPDELVNEYKVVYKPTHVVAKELGSRILIVPGRAPGSVVISLEAEHPKYAADLINQLMNEYKVVTIEDKNETKRKTIDFIDGRLKVLTGELDSVTRELLRYRQENNLFGEDAQSQNYFSKYEEADKAINELQIQLTVAQMIESYLSNPATIFNVVPSSFGLTDGPVNTLISAYNVAQLERKASIDARQPVTSPKVKQKEEEIQRIRESLFEAMRNYKSYVRATIGRLQNKSREAQALIQAMPLKQQNLAEIKKQQEMKQTVVNFLMEKKEDISMSLAGTISNSRVLEPAVVNPTPIKPDRRSIQLIAIIVGLAIPALIIFLKEMLNDRVDSRADIVKITNAPILGELGHSFNQETLVVKSGNRGVVAEQFRIVRSNLQFILSNLKKPVLLVTSSFSGEGKSFISTNIGAVMSLANKKTIVLEFDIRKPKILSGLNLPKRVGLTNYLLGKATLEELPTQVPGYENLYVLACGPVPPNPSELLLDPKMSELFAYLKQHFDVVVIDTAPVGMVSDAMTLSQFADATLYIVRQGHTFKKQVGLIDEFYQQKKLPKISLLLNDVKVRAGYGYYGYGRYGYGQAYGSGYFQEEAAPAPGGLRDLFGWMGLKKKNNNKRKKTKA
ncbi:polysaccharide biosynthesis tyrosine autokinase [Paraflavisolibacter sp. H34]|uniref:GumC family protein n=1 Tax=Huijunlia imazamoxiresistens TaxID=3127457 RepID=UPI003018B061